MACWVTLDELRPLLDNIGGDGIHIEMDFHNEREVEQAMKIVDDFKTSSNLHPSDLKDDVDLEVEEIIQRVENGELRIERCDMSQGKNQNQQSNHTSQFSPLSSQLVKSYCWSGCWPSCAFHIHSVIFMSEKTAVNVDSSGEQA